ncbi:MAG: SET domain-containing protein-lysine N-methyltransferase [Acidimicrobiia bacterium]
MRPNVKRAPDRPYIDWIAVADATNLLIPPGQPIHFGNHSCDPNLWHVDPFTLASRRDISAGEELTIDYATQTANPRVRLDCCCGSSRCRDRRGLATWRASGALRRALGAGRAPQDRHLALSRSRVESSAATG